MQDARHKSILKQRLVVLASTAPDTALRSHTRVVGAVHSWGLPRAIAAQVSGGLTCARRCALLAGSDLTSADHANDPPEEGVRYHHSGGRAPIVRSPRWRENVSGARAQQQQQQQPETTKFVALADKVYACVAAASARPRWLTACCAGCDCSDGSCDFGPPHPPRR